MIELKASITVIFVAAFVLAANAQAFLHPGLQQLSFLIMFQFKEVNKKSLITRITA